jgi:DNA-binding CsgD family transcriptional regulator
MLRGGPAVTTLAQPLVGRETELELLERMLDEACGGSSRFVVLSGEPGIGKTSLLTQLAQSAQERDCLVLEGRAAEFERELPFGLAVDAFDAYLEALDPRSYDRLAADGLDELASVFPSLRSLGGGTAHPTTAAERFRAHHAVRELIERLAARQPVLLALDDVHWSDGASLELIGHLVRRRPEAAVLVAIAYRAGQARPALAAAVEAALRNGEIERLEVGPLDAADAGRLVEGDARAQRDRLYRESGGNPFYLLQLARTATGESRFGRADGAEEQPVPALVAAAITGELAALPDEVRHFAQAGAVAGDPFELDLAVAAADRPEEECLAALDELIARDLVRAAGVPRRFRFRHPLVRGAIYESSPAGFRLIAHERIAAALAARGASAAARAHHVEQSARHGDAGAVEVLRDAGLEAAGRAPASAARWFGAALRVLPDSAEAAERGALLASFARAQTAVGQLESSRAALMEAIELFDGAAAPQRVALISACAGVEQLLGRHRDAHSRLETALGELSEQSSPEGAALMIDLAWDAGLDAGYGQMLDWAKRALEVARPLGDDSLTAAAAAIGAIAAASMGQREEAESLRAEAGALVDGMPDEPLVRRPHAFQWLAGASLFLDDYEAGMAYARRGLALARAGGKGELMPGITQALGTMLIRTGRLDDAIELLDGAVDAARLTDNAASLSWALGNRCYAAVVQGDAATAVAMGEETLAVTAGVEDSFVSARAGAPVAGALLLAGQPERAIDVLLSATGGEEMPLVPAPWGVVSLEVLARCRLELGRIADARETAARAEAAAAAFGAPLSVAIAERAQAAVAVAAGDARTAAKLALAAAERAEEAGTPIEAAMARSLAGRALGATGDAERAAAELEQAAARLDACGAHRHRDEAERDLRKLGKPVHRRTRRGKSDAAGLEALTGRELEIAQLVVGRRTNPEIAAELFLSIKTVETHMRNIFRKLGARTRVEVARIVEQAQAG